MKKCLKNKIIKIIGSGAIVSIVFFSFLGTNKELFSAKTVFAAAPDIAAVSASYTPQNPLQGDTITVTIGYSNIGTAPIATDFTAQLSHPGAVAIFPPLFTFSNYYLQPGESGTLALKVIYSNPGNYTLDLLLDQSNFIGDPNMANNQIYVPITIAPSAPPIPTPTPTPTPMPTPSPTPSSTPTTTPTPTPSSTPTPTPTPTPIPISDNNILSVKLSSSGGDINAGKTKKIDVKIKFEEKANTNIELSCENLPIDTSCSFSNPIKDGDELKSKLTISTSSLAVSGKYSIIVKAKNLNENSNEKTANYRLKIKESSE